MNSLRRILVIALAAFFASPGHATLGTSFQAQLGNPDNAATSTADPQRYLIARPQYSLSYNNTLREANWVSWSFTPSDRGSIDRTDDFAADPLLPPGFNVIDQNGYRNSGYDRGHLCPSADRTLTVADNQATFFMTNMVPQTADNNQGIWANFEQFTRDQAALGFEALVISGPSGFTSASMASGVAIPGYTWKIVALVPDGPGAALTRINAATRVIALKVPNIAGIRTTPWMNFVTSAARLQEETGLAFFTAIADPALRATLLAKIDGQPTNSLPSRLANLSTRTVAGIGDQVAIVGFVIGGAQPKPVLVRAVGPGLRSFGVASALAGTSLKILSGTTVLQQNSRWSTAPNVTDIAAAATSAGAFPLPADSADSAILTTLAPGNYTAHVSSTDATPGPVLLEVYELPAAVTAPRLANLAVRSTTGSGDNTFITGFVISGQAPRRLLIRAAGPALAGFGVSNPLTRPELMLRSGTGALLAQNAGWAASPDAISIADAFTRTGAFPFAAGSTDAALLVDLLPGSYTAQISGTGGTSGAALVEVYEVP